MRITLKIATSLDGRIGTSTGESQWITGPEARLQGHRLRAEHDAVLVGVETVLADDPRLTVRLPDGEQGRDPLRIVLDSKLRTPPFARLSKPGTLILTTRSVIPVGEAEVLRVTGDSNNRPALQAVLDTLVSRGVSSLMIEGGGRVAACFVAAGVVDAIEWFRAPILLGGDGRPGVAALSLARLAHAPRYRRLAAEPLGDDLWERYERV
ncbi:RibD family protein [Brevundimonas variabilis]|uniref:Diaminohydroxyphosphoribosylaminopyrimidine deaminase/5-amino-6-(5-phosphoribosylamino)uracil reductase n=1 Tax=Brevundimonas variabilis TaxID=74312 RepID=A0A7W9CH22_9CAUL|nr:RibD family protein [Brevundimonas variabilis]MBB5745500.1 diaminohydroxyphosphoribosylaminopyrimidine deaminase/5-amino-6-(5-phosphoribosylamino)uracil reductase [Brevundimonas variabilis]